MRLSVKLLAAAACAALLAPAAPAQRVKRIVAFGDSYADDGNLFELLGIPRPAVYPNGRFSDRTNFVDTMAQILNVPVDNFAIGGAFTGNGNINGPGIPGFVTEYQSFLAGGGPAAFPRVSGSFSPSDLLVLSIGGNDARAYQFSAGRTPNADVIATLSANAPSAAAGRVAEATTGLNALVGAGARNITFLAGDVGRLPEVQGQPISKVGTTFSTAFNTGIQASLANLASKGVIVNYLDLTQIGSVVEANLAAFGLVSAGACPMACVTTDPSLLGKYLFYVDQLHLTSRGFEIVGQYAVRQLEAPLTFASHTDIGLSAASSFGQMMSGRLDLAGAGGSEDKPLSFWLVGTAGRHDARASDTSLAYDFDSVGAAGGAEYDFGAGLIGLALSYSRPRTDTIGGTARVRAKAYQLGAYAKLEAGGAFGEAHAGFGQLDYALRRAAVIDEIEADTDGTTLVAGAEAGYLFELQGLKAGPVVGAQYARVKIDGFSERGDPVLRLNVSEQRASELIGFAGIEAQFEAEMGGMGVLPFVKLLAEKELDSSGGSISYALIGAPSIVNRFELEEGRDDVYGRIEAGASLELSPRIALQLQASGTVEHPEHDEFSGFIGLKIGF